MTEIIDLFERRREEREGKLPDFFDSGNRNGGQARLPRDPAPRLAFMGDETVAWLLFAPKGTEPILGILALESVGIVVDPVAGTLKRLPTLPLK